MAIDSKKVIEAIRAFVVLAEVLEELIDPEDKIKIDDTLIQFIKMVVNKL